MDNRNPTAMGFVILLGGTLAFVGLNYVLETMFVAPPTRHRRRR